MQSSFLRGTAKLDRDRAKTREQEDAKQLPACTAELDRDRAKAREREGAWQLPHALRSWTEIGRKQRAGKLKRKKESR